MCKMKKYFPYFILVGLVLIVLTVLPSVSALIYPQNRLIDLKIPCTLDGLPCSSSAECNITCQYPNSSYLINNQIMTNLGGGDFNYTTTFIEIGEYPTEVSCQDGGQNSSSTFTINITQTGSELSIAQGIIYIIFLAVLIFVFLLSLYGTIVFPWKHQRNPDGTILSINNFKCVKVLLFFISYLLLMFIFGIVKAITENFLYLMNIGNVFRWLFWIMFSFLWPLMVVLTLVAVVSYLNNLKIKEGLFRNAEVR